MRNFPNLVDERESSPVVGDIAVGGDVHGDIIVGNNNKVYRLTINEQHGDVYNYYTKKQVVQRFAEIPAPPRLPRGFIGRSSELTFMEKAISEKEFATFLYGHDGLGKSALLKQAANSTTAKGIPDGVIYLEKDEETGEQLGALDILQRVFDRLYSSHPPLKIKFDEAHTRLGKTSPLVILDGYCLSESDHHKLADVLRNSALIVSDRKFNGREEDFEPYKLTPLTRKDALELLSAKADLALDTEHHPAMDRICKLCGDVPLAILRVAGLIREGRVSPEAAEIKLASLQPPSQDLVQAGIERSFAVVYPLLDTDERAVLAAIAAAPGISVARTWLESNCRDPQTVSRLEALEIIQANSPRLRLADGYRQVIYATGLDLNPQRRNLLTYLYSRLRSQTLDFDFIAEELGNILGLIKWAVSLSNWEDVITLGRAVAPYLTLKGLWGAGQNVLKQVLLAGKKLNDQAAQAWALHQLGSMEIGAGTIPQAIKYLVRALQMRRAIGDSTGAKYTIHNLRLILPIGPNPLKRVVTILGTIVILAIVAIFLMGDLTPRQPEVLPTPVSPMRVPDCEKRIDWPIYIAREGDTYASISERVAASQGNINSDELPLLRLVIQKANCSEALGPDAGQEVYLPYPLTPATPTPPTPIVPGQEIALTLSRNPNDTIRLDSVGHTINYEFQITNNLDLSFQDPPRVSDSKETTTGCPAFNTIGNGDDSFDYHEVLTCTSTYPITQADLDSGSVTNTAIASIGDYKSNEASLSVDVEQNPSISLKKEASPSVFSQVGQTIKYIYTVQNNGNVTLAPATIFIMDDHINAGAAFLCGSESVNFAPGDEISCSADYYTTETDVDARSIINNATAFIESHGILVLGSEQAIVVVMYADQVSLSITASQESYNNPGEVIIFAYELANINDTDLPGPVSGLEFAHCPDFDVLKAKTSITCTEEYTVTQSDLDNDSITRTATANVSGIDSNGFTLVIHANQQPGLTLTQAVIPTSFGQTGQTVTFTYTIQNSGNVTLGPAQFTIHDRQTNNTPPQNCGPADTVLAPHTGSLTCSSQYITASRDIEAGSIVNSALASVIYRGSPIFSDPDKSEISYICPGPPAGWVTYTVQSGETLYDIGLYTDATIAVLQTANCLSTPNQIYSGQKLYVPPISISGKIFVDPDGDGIGDAPFDGFTVELRNTNGILIITSITDSNGNYKFTGIPPGDYYILKVHVLAYKPETTDVNFVVSPTH
jgi:uncharacterized repeat protein (TIGR01451 family)